MDIREMPAKWNNFKTGGQDFRLAPTTDREARQYIPQDDATQQVFTECREDGMPVLDSLLYALCNAL